MYAIKDQKLEPFLSKKPANKVKSKIQSTRLKKDYDFLKNLEQSLEKIDVDKFKDTANANDMNTESDQGEVVLDLIEMIFLFTCQIRIIQTQHCIQQILILHKKTFIDFES